MAKILKLFFLVLFILVAAFFANFYGYISIPWLDFNSVPTYGSEVKAADEAVEKVFKDDMAN